MQLSSSLCILGGAEVKKRSATQQYPVVCSKKKAAPFAVSGPGAERGAVWQSRS